MKRLIPKMQTAWGTLQPDNTYVAKPVLVRRIPYSPQPNEQVIRVHGQPVVVRHNQTYIDSPDSHYMSDINKDTARREAEEQLDNRNMQTGARRASGLIRLTLPSTYIGPLFYDGDYLANFGKGTGNEARDFVIDMAAFSLPGITKRLLMPTVNYNLANRTITATEDEINTLIRKQLGKDLAIGGMDSNGNFRYTRIAPDLVTISPLKNGSVMPFMQAMNTKYKIWPVTKTAYVKPSTEFEEDVGGLFNPKTKAVSLNAIYNINDPASTYTHEVMGHATEEQVMGKTLKNIKYPTNDYKMSLMQKEPTQFTPEWQEWNKSRKMQNLYDELHALDEESSVKDLYEETIRQLQPGLKIKLDDGGLGINKPNEFRALLMQLKRNLFNASGQNINKMNELIDKQQTISDLLKYGPEDSAYLEQFKQIIQDAISKRKFNQTSIRNRIINILKYAPELAIPVIITKQNGNN